MKPITNFSLLMFVLYSLIITSCREDNVSTQPSGRIIPRTEGIYLFNTVEVVMDLEGYYSFAENIDSVRDEIEYIFTQRNEILTSVDEFGFDTTELGTQYFYATQYGLEGAETAFVFLGAEYGAITYGVGGFSEGHGWTCSNEKCCERCVPHDSLICTCHTTQESCILGTQTPKCKKDGITVA